MSIRSLLHTSEPAASTAGVGLPVFETVTKPPLEIGEAADCCCAAAQVRVVLPPPAGSASRPELRLCAHHYRETVAGLTREGADVYDAHGQRLTGDENFWADSGSTGKLAAPLPV